MIEKQIYYHDTDAGGVVYYGRYLNYLEEARTQYFIDHGISLDIFRSQEFLYAVRKCAVTYKSPARYGDIIVCDAQLIKMTAVQFFFNQTIREKKTNRVILDAEVTLVSLNKDFRPVAIPEHIQAKLPQSI